MHLAAGEKCLCVQVTVYFRLDTVHTVCKIQICSMIISYFKKNIRMR